MARKRNPVAIDFLRTEVQTAHVFASIASRATDAEKKRRNLFNARRGYDTLLYFANQFLLTGDETDEMRTEISDLRRELTKLGEKF